MAKVEVNTPMFKRSISYKIVVKKYSLVGLIIFCYDI